MKYDIPNQELEKFDEYYREIDSVIQQSDR